MQAAKRKLMGTVNARPIAFNVTSIKIIIIKNIWLLDALPQSSSGWT